MEKFKNNTKGITLVVLVITIIILLILATISIKSLTNTGIFEKAKEARDKTAAAAENQAKLLNEYEDELNKYISGTTEEKLADVVKVGDYVSYTPDTVSNTDPKYTTLISNLGTYSGSDANTTSTLTQENLKWRVLDVQNGQVRLISEVPTTSTITLSGYNGYNNAVKLLDDTCSTLYNNSKLANKVQNLKVEDITNHMTTQPVLDTKTYSPTYKYYPQILVKEKDQTVNGKVGSELNLSEQTEYINQTTKQQVDTWTLKYTLYSQSMNSKDSFKDSKYYELFINNGNNYPNHWMSSRGICFASYDDGSCNAIFAVNLVYSGGVDAYSLYISDGREILYNSAFRPVITLNSNVQIDTTNSRNGSTVEQAYVIK